MNTYIFILLSFLERPASYFAVKLLAVQVLATHSAKEKREYVPSVPHVQLPASLDLRTMF